MLSPRRRMLLILLLAAAAAAGAARRRSVASSAAPGEDEDGRAYLAGSVNLAREGVFSTDDPEEAGPKAPASVRSALYPAALGLAGAGAWSVAAAGAAAALGAAAAGPLGGLAAAALTVWEPRSLVAAGTLDIQLFFSLLISLFAAAAVFWARKPTSGRALLAGFAAGTTLLARSTLLPLPLFLAAWFWSRRRSEIPKPGRQWLCFVLAMLAAAAPAVWRGRAVLGTCGLSEAGTLEFVLAAGAAGIVSDDLPLEHTGAPGGPTRRDLYEKARDWSARGSGFAVAAFLREAAANPGRFLAAIPLRALNLWGWWLLLWPALWLAGRRPGRLDLWTLLGIAAFWNIHILILSSWRHLVPVIPVLAALAFSFRSERPVDALIRRAGWTALAGVLLLWSVGAKALAGEALAARPGAGAAAKALADAERAALRDDAKGAGATAEVLIARGPEDWQLLPLARIKRAAGDPKSCASLADHAFARWPKWGRAANDAAVCAALAGDQKGALARAKAAVAASPELLDAALTYGALLEREGRTKEAIASYDAALVRSRNPGDPLRAFISRERARLRSRR